MLPGILVLGLMAIASPLSVHAGTYAKVYNQYIGIASTGESVTLLSVKTIFRGGARTSVKYKIGGDAVESGIYCPHYQYDGRRAYFTDQGRRYAQSSATEKILSIACSYERTVSNKYGHLHDTSP
jgi:hypothetical protein